MCIIDVYNLKKGFKDTEILKNINLQIEEGDIIGIVGGNGCGKSVLLKIICGLITPDSGRVMVDNVEISKGKFPRDIGILLDNTGFLMDETGFNNLRYIARIEKKINDKQIKDILKVVGLAPEEKKKVRKYSLGMKQRLAIAMAIMENPKILLLDEPMNSIDCKAVEEIRKLLLDMNSKYGTTIIITSHNDEDIKSMCNRVFMIKNGYLNETTSYVEAFADHN